MSEKSLFLNSPPTEERILKYIIGTGTSVRLSLLQSVRLTVPSRDRATTPILFIRCHKPTVTRTVKSKNTRRDTNSHMGGIPLYLYAEGGGENGSKYEWEGDEWKYQSAAGDTPGVCGT